MASLTKALCTALLLVLILGFNCKESETTLLVLTDVNNKDSFSKFRIYEENGILIGRNSEDYPVKDGVYRIHGSSNDKYYNHNIIVVN